MPYSCLHPARTSDGRAEMTTFRVRVDQCRFTLQKLSAAHLFPAPHTTLETGPIVVSRLNDGNVLVHNGRHRVIRALLAGQEWLDAVSEYDDDDTTPPAAIFPGLPQVTP
jgi:hypothetical protein